MLGMEAIADPLAAKKVFYAVRFAFHKLNRAFFVKKQPLVTSLPDTSD